MIVTFTLPRLGETMESGRVATWLKKPGEAFKRGETLVEIESDKTVVEMPALADGVLHEIVIDAGEDVEVGAVLCRYEDGKADEPAVGEAASPTELPTTATTPDEAASARDLASSPETSGRAAFDPGDAHPAPPAAASTSSRRATPLARAIARHNGIVLEGLAGSGRRGRVEASDVRAALEGRETSDRPASTPAAERRRTNAPPASSGGVDAGGAHVERRDWSPTVAGPRLVLLHGLAADVQSWASLAGALSRAGRLVTAFDLPGHGGTTIEATDLDGAASAMADCLDGLGDEPVELVGHSVGGAIAVRVARRRPDRIRRLTLLAPAGLDRAIDVEFIRGIVGVQSAGALPHLLRRLAVRPQAMSAAQLEALAHELGRGRLASFADTLVDAGGQQIDITADLRTLGMPVRVVWGLQDRIIPWTQVKEVGGRCAVHLIQDAGHVPHWDQPAEVAALFD